jgi:hypothetical protein
MTLHRFCMREKGQENAVYGHDKLYAILTEPTPCST